MNKTIAVTGINAVDSPGPGVAVGRSIRELYPNARLVGLGYDAIDPGFFDSDLFKSGYMLPYPREGAKALLNRFRDIHSKTRLDIIVPTLDSEMQNFAEIEPQLKEMGIRLFIPTSEQIKKRSKANLGEFALENGFKVPKTLSVYDHLQLEQSARDLGFPLLVKGLYYDAYLCSDFSQVSSYAQIIAAKWGYPLLLQEYLTGEELNAAAIGDGSGITVAALCMKKIHFTDKGKGWAGVSIKNNGLLELTYRFIDSVNWKGPLEMEIILAARDQELYIIEINPRFPAWIYLGVAAGNNLPAHYVKLASGQKMKPQLEYQTGKLFTHYTIDLIGEISQLDSLLSKGEIHY